MVHPCDRSPVHRSHFVGCGFKTYNSNIFLTDLVVSVLDRVDRSDNAEKPLLLKLNSFDERNIFYVLWFWTRISKKYLFRPVCRLHFFNGKGHKRKHCYHFHQINIKVFQESDEIKQNSWRRNSVLLSNKSFDLGGSREFLL